MALYFRSLIQRSLSTFWEMATIMVPVMILMRVAESYGLIDAINPALRPVMAVLNLPPEAAIVCLTSILTGLYGAIATLPVLVGLELTAAQVTSICAIMLIAHALPLEQAIVRRAGGSFWGTSVLRLVTAALAAWLIDLASRLTGVLSEPQSLGHFAAFAKPQADYIDWALSNLVGLGVLLGILTGLLVMMDAFNHLGVTGLINRALAPVLRLSGLAPSVASITTAGVVLGVAYGGGLIIAERDNPDITPNARHYALCWLSLCHGMIEDVALMVAIGGNFWMLFAGRLVLTLIVVRILMLGDHWMRRKRLQPV